MSITRTNLDNSRIRLQIHVGQEDVDHHFEQQLIQVTKETTVSGFRKGEAPKEMVKQQVGTEALLQQALDTVINEHYQRALEAEQITPIEQASVSIGDLTEEGLEFTAEFDAMPEVELPDYAAIAKEVKKEEFQVSTDDIEEAKIYIRRSRGSYQDVDRPAKTGDVVAIDYILNVDDEEKDRGEDMSVEIGQGQFITGFEDNLIGLSSGDEHTFSITFPEDYQAQEFAGKTGEFSVTVKKVQELNLPEWTDEFVQSLTQNPENTTESMEQMIREGLDQEKAKEADNNHKQAIIDAILQQVTIDIPQTLLESEQNRIIQEMEQKAQQSGESLDQTLERVGKDRNTLKEEVVDQAKSRASLMLILRKIADKEDIQASEDQISKEMNGVLARYSQEDIKNIDTDRLRLMIEGEILDTLTLDFLAGLSKPQQNDQENEESNS